MIEKLASPQNEGFASLIPLACTLNEILQSKVVAAMHLNNENPENLIHLVGVQKWINIGLFRPPKSPVIVLWPHLLSKIYCSP